MKARDYLRLFWMGCAALGMVIFLFGAIGLLSDILTESNGLMDAEMVLWGSIWLILTTAGAVWLENHLTEDDAQQ